MNRMFSGYAAFLLLVFAVAAHEGYALNALFSPSRHAIVGHNNYHK